LWYHNNNNNNIWYAVQWTVFKHKSSPVKSVLEKLSYIVSFSYFTTSSLLFFDLMVASVYAFIRYAFKYDTLNVYYVYLLYVSCNSFSSYCIFVFISTYCSGVCIYTIRLYIYRVILLSRTTHYFKNLLSF